MGRIAPSHGGSPPFGAYAQFWDWGFTLTPAKDRTGSDFDKDTFLASQRVSMISQDLLNILRCPACVSGPGRKPGQDPGRLVLVRDCWLACQESGCGRKYPIVEDIPVMLIDTGDKWAHTSVDDLPVPPPA